MRVVVPYATEDPKSRLAGVLSASERDDFSRAMLADVLEAIRAAGGEPEVLATAPIDVDAPVTVDERSLTTAVNAVLAATDDEIAIVMADLGLATPAALSRLFEGPGDVVLAPGRGGGTNAIVVRHPDFRVDYHGTSYVDHLQRAAAIGASVYPLDSNRLATDVDEPADLIELLLHGEGAAAAWLREAGFVARDGDGRIRVDRPSDAPDGLE